MIEGSEQLLPGERPAPIEITAPILPIEGHVIASALALQHAENSVRVLACILQNSPRDFDTMERLFRELEHYVATAHGSFNAYRAVITCQGQA